MAVDFIDGYRQYPWRMLGYVNAITRPFIADISKPVYQVSLGIMHTYFLTNSYDYANKIDSKSRLSSALDCYTWHCAASWVGPALVVDHTIRVVKKYSSRRSFQVLGAYTVLAIASPIMDRTMNWYFYGFWNAGNKEKPRLNL
jgi:hypothetical protein